MWGPQTGLGVHHLSELQFLHPRFQVLASEPVYSSYTKYLPQKITATVDGRPVSEEVSDRNTPFQGANTMQPERPECSHYVRRCLMIAPCCNKTYPCRLCHDGSEEHELKRFEVQTLICTQCGVQQPVATHCQGCGIMFGMYSCIKCRMFDDRDKSQFHCDKCGLCRVGGRDNFFHCDKCEICLSTNIRNTHKCRYESGKDKCPVCFESVHTATEPSLVPGCGHLIHSKCHKLIMEFGHQRCPYCNQNYNKMNRSQTSS